MNIPAYVDNDNRSSVSIYDPLKHAGVEHKAVIHIHKHHSGSRVDCCGWCCEKSVRRDNYLSSRDPETSEDYFQRARATVDRDCMIDSNHAGVGLLKLFCEWSKCEPT